MKSKLIYGNGKKGINVITGDFLGYKDLAYNNLMEVGFKPEGTGRVICKFDDFILLKLEDIAPDDITIDENISVRIKMDERVYVPLIEELAGQENLEKTDGLNGLFLTLKGCITHEIDLEKRILIVATKKYSYIFNYDYINTFIESKEKKVPIKNPPIKNPEIKERPVNKKTRRFRND